MYKYSNKTFDELLALSGWQPEDGPYPGVFSKMPAGEKCLWSTLWIDDEGFISPQAIGPNSPEAWKYELQDIAARGNLEAARILQDGLEVNEQHLRQFINDARSRYGGEFCFPYTARAAVVMWPRFRDGWPRPAWAALPG